MPGTPEGKAYRILKIFEKIIAHFNKSSHPRTLASFFGRQFSFSEVRCSAIFTNRNHPFEKMARTRKKKTDTASLASAESIRSFKSVTIDNDIVVTNHGLEDMRDDQQAAERQEAFSSGTLQRATRINMSGGPD